MTISIHQVVVGASARDAISNMAKFVQEELAKSFSSSIFSYFEPEESAKSFVKQISQMPMGTDEDLIVYHSSFGLPLLTQWLLSRPEKIVICYHNITPAKYYEAYDADFATGLSWGRTELQVLSHKIVKFVTVSEYNRSDLEVMGFSDISVIPAGLNPNRLREVDVSTQFLVTLDKKFPSGFLLSMSQVLPHKRTELAIATTYLLKTIYDIDFGLVIAGAQRNRNYLSSLETFAGRLGLSDVWFIGEVNEKELLTLYQSASFFLGTSDHEGLSIPPLEAMANGLVCIVRGCGAVAETVGDGAVVLDSSSGAVELAAAVSTLFRNKSAQARLRINGRAKVSEIERQHPERLFHELLFELQK